MPFSVAECTVLCQVCVRAATPQELPAPWQHVRWWYGCSFSAEGCYWGHTVASGKPGQEGLQVPACGSLRAGKLCCGIKIFAVLQHLLPSPVCSVCQLLNFYSLQLLLGSRRLALVKPEPRIQTNLLLDCCLCGERDRGDEGRAFFQF